MDIYKLHYPGHVNLDQEEHYPEHEKYDREVHYSLAIGFFDGLHKGHLAVINQAKKKAKELNIRTAIMTFDPHPSHLLGGGKNKVDYITSFEEKCELLHSMGIDTLFVVKFDQPLAALMPQEFIDVFIKGLGVQHVTAGFDFRFGSKGAGTMEMMAELSEGVFGTTIVGKVTDGEEEISSTRIRNLLSQGDVIGASLLLGRNFRTFGKVVDGEKKGRQLGFPTANVLPQKSVVLPANGVYAVRFLVDGQQYNGVCNVGVKPTFNNPDVKSAIVEVHVFDFDGDLYGKEVAVEWIEYIRAEKKFDSIDALIAQIEKDKKEAMTITSKAN